MTKNLNAITLSMMLDRMTKYSTNGPGQAQILGDMKRLTEGVDALVALAESTDDVTSEQRLARTTKAASKLGASLPAFTERLDKLDTETQQGFELAFAQNSGLVQTARAAEIRAHVKTLADLGNRVLFLQGFLAAKVFDGESLGAVVFAPAYLSGLDAEMHTRLKSQIEQTRLPEIPQNREVFSELSGNLRVALTVAEKAVRELQNPRLLAGIEQGALAAKAAEDRLNAATAPVVLGAAI